VFVTKLNAAGSALSYSTFLGGGTGQGVTVDSSGNAYVTGYTCAGDYPATAGAFQTTLHGCFNAFVTKVNATGTALGYSTFLGGTNTDIGYRIAVDAARNAYVTGNTCSTDFPTTLGAYQTTLDGCYDLFVTKLNTAGSALTYSTYLGGAASDFPQGLTFDSAGSAYVTGYTSSADFPTTAGAFQPTRPGGFDAFVTKLNAAGSALAYSTYLGGASDDVGRGVAIDSAGNAYVAGNTCSNNFPTTVGAFQSSLHGCADAFVTRVNAVGSALDYSSYLGGSSNDIEQGIARGPTGSIYLTGNTTSTDFPTTAGAFQTSLPGNTDVFVTRMGQDLSLAPQTTTRAAGTQHCETATVKSVNSPNPGAPVVFAVTGQNSAGPTTQTTDASGKAK
jgi:hypothetical protein